MSAARTLCLLVLSALAIALPTAPALAQATGYYQPVAAYPAEMGFSQSHSSTALEGALRGRAAVIQSLGNYRLLDSQAKILDEQARSLAYDNDVKQTETLYEKKALWRQHKDEQRARAISRDALGKQLLAQRQATYYRDVYRLTDMQLNRSSGRILWPAALEDQRYTSLRSQLEFLFRQRARQASASGDPFAQRILMLTDQLKQELKQQIDQMDPASYADAQKFVRGLFYEVQYDEQIS